MTTINEDKMLPVAKEVFDNMPEFENKDFQPKSVNEAGEKLQEIIDKGDLSPSWIDSVYNAIKANQPVYIGLNKEWQWNFLTMKSGTRQDILEELAKMGPAF